MGKLDEAAAVERAEDLDELSDLLNDDYDDQDYVDLDETGDDDALDVEFTETRTAPIAEPAPRDVIHAEPVSDEFSNFLDSLPNDEITTIVVNRLADRNYSGQFRIPCDATGHADTIYWKYPKTAPEIYTEIQLKHGGGVYQFQVRQGAGFQKGKTWSQIIRDPAGPSKAELRAETEKAKQEEQQRKAEPSLHFAVNPAPAAAPVKTPFEEMRDRLREAQEIRELLGISDDRRGSEPQPYSADEQIRMKIFDKMADNPELQDRLIDYGFGLFKRKEEKSESWIDLAKHAMKNPAETMQLVGGVLSMGKGLLFGSSPASPPAPRPSLNMPMAAGTVSPIQTATPAAPAAGLQMPPVQRQEDVSPAPGPETQPAATQRPATALKRVEW